MDADEISSSTTSSKFTSLFRPISLLDGNNNNSSRGRREASLSKRHKAEADVGKTQKNDESDKFNYTVKNHSSPDSSPTKGSGSERRREERHREERHREERHRDREKERKISRRDNNGSHDNPVETVDRGVGPTPHPQSAHASPETRIPPYFGVSPYDPRNGLLDPHAAGYPYPYPAFPFGLTHPLPVTTTTNEGRYQWPPHPMTLPPFAHGLAASPTLSDPALGLRSPLPSEPIASLASRLHWEQLRAMQYSPISHRALGAAALGAYPHSYLPHPHMPHPHHALSSLGQRSIFDHLPAPPGASTNLPGSLESSHHLSSLSPRPSLVGKSGRKRALSHSPFSECGLDIESLTRSSEGSLILGFSHNARSSTGSAASGSYGHLSAASLGAISPAPGRPGGHHMFPSGLPGSPFFPPLLPHPFFPGSRQPPQATALPSSHILGSGAGKSDVQLPSSSAKDAGSSVVSSTVTDHEHRKTRIKKEDMSPLSVGSAEDKLSPDSKHYDDGRCPQEGEPDFCETNCHWTDCDIEFETQEELVRHINQEHIAANKRQFVCRWQECSREEKPFKAQYMLVVHMRRHTGEKPHRCTFEGCNKAYSRLENLKTHLRSHTGEKPYMCEFPGCAKAFSNASDRAKHQNRTHSNAKPYVCKAPGCTKRYTDPSSLRKHVKTVHGPDFYANKKHKGDHQNGDDSDHKPESGSEGGRLMVKQEECSPASMYPVTPGSHDGDSRDGSGMKLHSQESSGSSNDSPRHQTSYPSPASHGPSTHSPGSIHQSPGGVHHSPGGIHHSPGGFQLEAEVESLDEDCSEEILLPATTVGVASVAAIRASNRIPQNRLKRIQAKNAANTCPVTPSSLPPIGNSRRIGHSGPSIASQKKLLSDTISATARDSLGYHSNRRDSNCSTLSSYMSSVHSDASPFPFHSSQRSSDLSRGSSSRLSIANSPYEYDLPGQSPYLSESGGIYSMTAQFERAKLGSTHSLDDPNTNLDHVLHQHPGHQPGLKSGKSTPSRTPLPLESVSRQRRASDPIRGEDVAALKQFQRTHSLNAVRPLPVPSSMKSLQRKADSNHNFMSSRSSIATDYSIQTSEDFDMVGESLDVRMIEESDDMIIPDDMKQFLSDQQADSTVPDNSPRPSNLHPQRSPAHRKPGSGSLSGSAASSSSCMHQNAPPPIVATGPWNGPVHQPTPIKPDQPILQSCQQQTSPAAPNSAPGENAGAYGNLMVSPQMQNLMMDPRYNSPPAAGGEGMYSPGSYSPGSVPCPPKTGSGRAWTSSDINAGQPCPDRQTWQAQQQWALQQQLQGGWPQGGNNMSPQQRYQCNQNYGPVNSDMRTRMLNQRGEVERGSPQVQVPHISQSQIPPSAKTAGQAQFRQQQQQRMRMQAAAQGTVQDTAQGYTGSTPQHNMQGMQYPQNMNMSPHAVNMANPHMYQGGQYPGMGSNPHQQWGHMTRATPNMHQGMMGNHRVNMMPQQPQHQNQPQQQQHQTFTQHPQQSVMPNCASGVNQGNSFPQASNGCHSNVGVQMSPNCNQVTSTTDAERRSKSKREASQVGRVQSPSQPQAGLSLNNLPADNFLDNLSSISMENLNNSGGPLFSPLSFLGRSASQASSRLNTPQVDKSTSGSAAFLDTSNMVVNDMSSTLTQLAEENRFYSMR